MKKAKEELRKWRSKLISNRLDLASMEPPTSITNPPVHIQETGAVSPHPILAVNPPLAFTGASEQGTNQSLPQPDVPIESLSLIAEAPGQSSPFISQIPAQSGSPASVTHMPLQDTGSLGSSIPLSSDTIRSHLTSDTLIPGTSHNPPSGLAQTASQSRSSLTAVPPNAVKSSNRSQNLSSIVETGWQGFKLALAVLKESSAVFPPLQSAVGGLLKVIEVKDKVADNQKNLDQMTQQIMRLSQVFQQYSANTAPKHVQDTIDAFTKSIERRKAFIEERMNRGPIGRVLNASEDATEIINSLREMTFAVELFQIRSSINIEAQGRQILQRELLKILDAASGARYDESSHTGCMAGTRVDTLSLLLAWAADPNSQPIFWLSGMAGIGKSAIAHSFCQMIDNGQLGASFFCSRQSESLNNVSRILPTIAHQLAYRSPAYRAALVDLLGQSSRTSYALTALQQQAQDLFINLKDELKTDETLIIVIDALDECAGFSDTGDFLRVVLRSGLPVKFLITSRPETHIGAGFSSEEQFEIDQTLDQVKGFLPKLLSHASLRLHDVEKDIVEEDISRYLSSKLLMLLERVDRGNAQKKINALTKKSGNLFIFAFTAVQYITPRTSANLSPKDVQRRLLTVLETSDGQPGSALSTRNIDSLYQQIFVSAYNDKEEFEIMNSRASLDTLLCLCKPQSISVISLLLELEPVDVRAHLANFSSVLNIPDNDEALILAFHASFPDYVFDQRRSGTYALNKHDQHYHVALACLKLMNTYLHKDMCDIKSRQTRNSDIGASIIRSRIPLALHYACIYWASHLAVGANAIDTNLPVLTELTEFLTKHLLHWLEVLSLLQELHVAFNCVQKASFYVLRHASNTPEFGEMQGILLDAQNMIPQVYYFLKLYPLEVYVSALAWLPTMSVLRAKYANELACRVVLGLEDHWDPCLQTLQCQDAVNCLAFAPSGINLACGAKANVQIWNLETSELIKTLSGHGGLVTSIAFSLDGSQLASGSNDRTARIWSVDTGELISQLTGHTGWVVSVAFSQDGSKLASGSYDRSVHIWDTDSAKLVTQLTGHRDYVRSVAFSPDGLKLASGSDDKTVRIWHVSSGKLVIEMSGHADYVRTVAFWPSGSMLASGSVDQTVRIWDANTGKLVKKLSGHTGWVTSVAVSSDGIKLASGSDDKTVRIWDATTWELMIQPRGHQSYVRSVAFSVDSSKLASGSHDKTVQIWNAISDAHYTPQPSGHRESIASLAFSPDGSRIASGSDDKTARIWDTGTGRFVKAFSNIDRPRGVKSVAFSLDGDKLVSGSDTMADIWNINTGRLHLHLNSQISRPSSNRSNTRLVSPSPDDVGTHIENITRSNRHGIMAVAFSPDGSKLASGSADQSVLIWNPHGQVARLITRLSHPIEEDVMSIAFSPDGSMLVAGTAEGHVVIWDARTYKLLGRLPAYMGSVRSAAFSLDGSLLASASFDSTVSIWNADTNQPIEKLQNHSFAMWSDVSNSVLWSIYIKPGTQCCITSKHIGEVEAVNQLWLWGPYLRWRITAFSFSRSRVCIGYETGKILIIHLPDSAEGETV